VRYGSNSGRSPRTRCGVQFSQPASRAPIAKLSNPQARPHAEAVLQVLCSEGEHAGCGATHPARTRLPSSPRSPRLTSGSSLTASVRQGRAATRLTVPAPVNNVACGTSCNLGRVAPQHETQQKSRSRGFCSSAALASCGLAFLLHAWVPPVVRGLATNSARKEGECAPGRACLECRPRLSAADSSIVSRGGGGYVLDRTAGETLSFIGQQRLDASR